MPPTILRKTRSVSCPPKPVPSRSFITLALTCLGATAPAVWAEEARSLADVVVTAAGFAQDIQNAPASITVITREQLQQRRTSNIAEAVADIEGIDTGAGTSGSNKTGGQSVSMRGLPSDYTLILIDGRRQNAAGNVTPNAFNDTATSFMPPISAIERIEVIRGPMSTLYGSDAMGGVINIITRKVGKRWTGETSVEGTFQGDQDFGNSRAANFYVSGPIVEDRVGVQFRGRVYDRDASDLDWPGKSTNQNALLTMGQNPVRARVENYGIRLSLTPNKNHDLSLDLEQGRQRYHNDHGEMGTLDTPKTASGYSRRLRFNRDQYALAHTWRFDAGLLESSLMRNTTETTGRTIPSGTPGKTAGSPRKLETESLVFDSKLVTEMGAHMLSLGTQWLDADMTDGIATGRYSYTQWGLFIEDEWRLAPEWALTLGLRNDRHSEFGNHLNPRAYLLWNASDQWTFKGGVSRGFKAPGLEQMFDGIVGYGAQGTRPIYGNKNLEPERSISSELSAQFRQKDLFSASATLFYTTFKDKISSTDYLGSGIPAGALIYENVDDAVAKGIELNLSANLAKALVLQGNYTYTRSEQKSGANQGDPLTNTPDHMLNATLKWQATPELATWIRGEYRSERFRSRDTANTQLKSTLGDFKSYTTFDLGATYQISKQVTLNATVYNLLDKDFVDYRPYLSRKNTSAPWVTSYANTYNNNIEPRRLWVSLNFGF